MALRMDAIHRSNHSCKFPSNVQTYIPSNADWSTADELKKYKELKDRGVITEEEFQTKKDKLMNLL